MGEKFYCSILIIIYVLSAFFVRVEASDLLPAETGSLPEDSLELSLASASGPDRVKILLGLTNRHILVSVEKAQEYAYEALKESRLLGNDSILAEAYKAVGNICYYQGENLQAIRYYDSSLFYYSGIDDSLGISKIFNNLGITFSRVGLFNKSLEYHIKSLEIKEKFGDTTTIVNSLNNIGSIYISLENFDKALEYFEEALRLATRISNRYLEQVLLNNIGMIYNGKKDYRHALLYFRQSLDKGAAYANQEIVADAYLNIGKSYSDLNRYDSALFFFFKSYDIYEKLGINRSLLLNNIGQVYIESQDYASARNYLLKALSLAKAAHDAKDLVVIYKNLSVLNERTGNYQAAYQNHMLFKAYEDSLHDQVYSRKLLEVEAAYEIESAEKEIELLKKEKRLGELELMRMDNEISRQRMLIYTFLAVSLLIIVFSYFIFRLYRQKIRVNETLISQNKEIMKSKRIIENINKVITENEKKFRMIFDSSPYGISLARNDGTIIDCNPAGVKLFGHDSKEEILGRNISDYISDKDREEGVRNFQVAFKKERRTKNEYILRRKDGSEFIAEISAVAMKDADNNPVALLTNTIDITDRVNFIEDLKEAKSKAEESDRLKSAFLANMSHEIRTPMNSIIGFVNLLAEGNATDEEKRIYTNYIVNSSSILLNLINDIIDISKIEAGQLRLSNSTFCIEELMEELHQVHVKQSKNSRVKLLMHLPDYNQTTNLYSDAFRIRQVLSNLIGNAIKFTERGLVEFGFKKEADNGRLTLNFFVRDTGPGIPADKVEHIFERFIQLETSHTRKYGGTGLGLAISRSLARMLGGDLYFVPNKPSGSVFWFVLPFEEITASGN